MNFFNLSLFLLVTAISEGISAFEIKFTEIVYEAWNEIHFFPADHIDNNAHNEQNLNYEIPCGISNVNSLERIVGGDSTIEGEFPWLVSLQQRNNEHHFCGGSIINSKWVLTAAHCAMAFSTEDILVVAGKYDLWKAGGHEQYRTLKSWFITEYFDVESMRADIALLQLDKPLELDSNFVAPICLPFASETFDGFGTVIGWGRIQENGALSATPRKANLQIISGDNCTRIYQKLGFDDIIWPECQICTLAQNKDECQGDSGGPLMCQNETGKEYYICGIISWGIGCGRPYNPGVNTKVSCFTDWIIKTINENK